MEIKKLGYSGRVSAMGVSIAVEVVEIHGKVVLHQTGDSLDKEKFYVMVEDREVLDSILNILNMVE